MGNLAKDVTLTSDSIRFEEERDPYLGLEDYIERLEEKAAREEFLDSYEYHSLMASLLA
jgi:hypothetical protein